MLGLLVLQRGEIVWNGRRLADPTSWMRPPRVAYTAQVPALLSGSVRENILLGLPDDEPLIRQAIWRAAFERDLAGLAHGLDTPIGAGGVRLSGGQAQRLAAARMLVRQAELLVVDDLSSALDHDTEQVLWQRLRHFGDTQPAILAVSYRSSLMQQADQIVVLDQGRVAARGTYGELLHSSALFRSIVQAGPRHESRPA